MRKLHLGLLAFSPMLIGYIFNLTAMIPLFLLLAFIMPFVMLGYWFWVGGKFAEVVKNPIIAILLGNIFGIISFVIYYWQFIILTGENRSLPLAIISQAFNSPLTMITVRVGRLFESVPNSVTQSTVSASHALGLLFMVLVFSTGYFYSKKNVS